MYGLLHTAWPASARRRIARCDTRHSAHTCGAPEVRRCDRFSQEVGSIRFDILAQLSESIPLLPVGAHHLPIYVVVDERGCHVGSEHETAERSNQLAGTPSPTRVDHLTGKVQKARRAQLRIERS